MNFSKSGTSWLPIDIFIKLSIGSIISNQQSAESSYEKSPNPSTNSGFLSNMLFTVFVVSSVHPQSPATAKLNSEGATYVGWYGGLITPYTIIITIIKEAKAEIMTKSLFNYGVPSYLYTLYAYKTP